MALRGGRVDAGVVPHDQPVDVDGVRLVVRTWTAARPAAPVAVLLPATGETAEDWDDVAGALSGTRTVHAVNLRGHGRSDWPGTYSTRLFAADVEGLLPELADGPVDLVGHSLGGLVACRVAAARPDLVRRLVLEDVGLLRPRPAAPPERPDGPLTLDWAVVEQVRPEVDDPDPAWREVVARIVAPTLVVGGGPRSSLPQDQVADLVSTVPDARLVTLDTGHLVHANAPADFVAAVLDFLG